MLQKRDDRWLLRLANSAAYDPSSQETLLKKFRQLTSDLPGRILNLRVTPVALEFDVFVAPGAPIDPYQGALQTMGRLLSIKKLDQPVVRVLPQACMKEAQQLWNEQRFWEVHEVLEALWKQSADPEKSWVQGLILAAAAKVHQQKNEPGPVAAMHRQALTKLEGSPAQFWGWDLARLKSELKHMSIMNPFL